MSPSHLTPDLSTTAPAPPGALLTDECTPGIRRGTTRAKAGWLTWLFILLTLAFGAAPTPAAEDAYDNVVILLDSSGSMAENMAGTRLPKLAAAKTALKEVLGRLPPSTHIGVLIFGGGGNRPEDWIYALGPRDEKRLVAAIDRVRADGGTPLGAYIKRAADRLLEQRAQQLGYGTFRLLVVSDGEAQDPESVDRYTPEVMARGITVDVIGVAMAQRHTLATRVHSYRAADNPESLRRALRDVLAEVGGPGTDLAEADAFALLAPLPMDLAAAAIQTLATTGNQPIGEVAASTPRTTPPAPAAAPPSPAIPPVSPFPPAPRTAPTLVRAPLGLAGLFCLGSVILVLAIRSFFRRR